MALFKPWRYLVSKPPNLDVAKEARILCDVVSLVRATSPFMAYEVVLRSLWRWRALTCLIYYLMWAEGRPKWRNTI